MEYFANAERMNGPACVAVRHSEGMGVEAQLEGTPRARRTSTAVVVRGVSDGRAEVSADMRMRAVVKMVVSMAVVVGLICACFSCDDLVPIA